MSAFTVLRQVSLFFALLAHKRYSFSIDYSLVCRMGQ